ncbi:putative short-chain dehydrogenase [Periconia macrospinosa]|uniref:Putative short-chain dehydrogenase n=1 Tax=Periconia macrospinosa TaxID=97972 RepID=A0A2V1E7E1_9PLEO|nr:putative short-chain dehydrogenase [Periconia macrospinosa]
MPGFLSFVRDQYATLELPRPSTNISDATYIVTGANTGLGYECAKHLFQMGAGRIIIAVRSRAKGEAALATIRRETGRQSVGEVWDLDLSSLDSVEEFSKRIQQLDRLDALIENAGVAMGKFQTLEGMEMSLYINVLSTMLLALRALPKLQESAHKFGIRPNLVIVSSNTALDDNIRLSADQIDGDVFDTLSTAKVFDVMTQYPRSKLLEIYAVRQLASLFPVSESGVTINAVNPGMCYSELDRNGNFRLRLLMAIMRALLARSTEKGSRNLVQAAFAGSDSHGSYFSECRAKNEDLPTWITDKDGKRVQEHIWADLLKRLESTGHGVDIASLRAKK